MTTYDFRQVTCSICGTASEQQVLMSTNTLGFQDLDLRPPEMQRSTMSTWLHECPSCGFVSEDLTNAEEGTQELLAAERFKALHQDRALSGTLIGRCLKRSFLAEELGNALEAANCALWAAWAADDSDNRSAIEYRSKAADLFLAAASAAPAGSEGSIMMRTRTVDILRRARRWDEAIGLADAVLADDALDPTIRSIVEFGRRLSQAGDHSTHTVQDAIPG